MSGSPPTSPNYGYYKAPRKFIKGKLPLVVRAAALTLDKFPARALSSLVGALLVNIFPNGLINPPAKNGELKGECFSTRELATLPLNSPFCSGIMPVAVRSQQKTT
jgi:hypothetical protein